jgi:hypothetical protein
MYQSLNYKGVVNAQLILYSTFFLLITDAVTRCLCYFQVQGFHKSEH